MSNMKIKSSLRDYSVIFIDRLIKVGDTLRDYKKQDVIIVDKNVKKLWSSLFNEVTANVIEIEATEKTKSYYQIGEIIQKLIDNGFKKNGKIVAIGGGITQDICGFVSSVMFRGVEWDFFPTTLLAQGDSCIGGKTSVNFGNYKNLYQSKIIIGYSSTMLREAFAFNKKVLCLDFANIPNIEFASDGICLLKSKSYDLFEKRIELINKLSYEDYLSQINDINSIYNVDFNLVRYLQQNLKESINDEI